MNFIFMEASKVKSLLSQSYSLVSGDNTEYIQNRHKFYKRDEKCEWIEVSELENLDGNYYILFGKMKKLPSDGNFWDLPLNP